MKKGLLALALVFVLGSLVACGSDGQPSIPFEHIEFGEKLIEVPDVTNENLAAAEETLKAAGFTNVASEYQNGDFDDAARLIVAEQSSAAGESVTADTEIILTCRRLCKLVYNITSRDNWIFSKYDMVVLLDGEELGVVANGATLSGTAELIEGTCELRVEKADDSSVAATYVIELPGDVAFGCEMEHGGAEITFEDIVIMTNDITDSVVAL